MNGLFIDYVSMEEKEMNGNDNQVGDMLGRVKEDDSLSSSSSSEDSSMEFEINEDDMKKIMRLETSLEENPNQYDVHLEYVALLRTCRMQERLKDARRCMHETFPMQEDMWLEWIHDEIENAESLEDLDRIGELFDACHKDYLSVTLWVEHIGCAGHAILKMLLLSMYQVEKNDDWDLYTCAV